MRLQTRRQLAEENSLQRKRSVQGSPCKEFAQCVQGTMRSTKCLESCGAGEAQQVMVQRRNRARSCETLVTFMFLFLVKWETLVEFEVKKWNNPHHRKESLVVTLRQTIGCQTSKQRSQGRGYCTNQTRDDADWKDSVIPFMLMKTVVKMCFVYQHVDL